MVEDEQEFVGVVEMLDSARCGAGDGMNVGGLFGLWLMTTMAMAMDEVVPTPREVLTLSDESICPDIVSTHVPGLIRTSVGLAINQGDGSYRLACASGFGGLPDGPTVSSPDGGEIYMATEGALYRSGDRGCTAAQIPLDEGTSAVGLVFWRLAFWVLTTTDAGGGQLLRWSGEELVEVVSWTTFRPDGMVVEDAEHVWVAGALPFPEVRRLSFAGGIGDDVPIEGLPEDLANIERVVPIVAQDGEAWFRVERTVQK